MPTDIASNNPGRSITTYDLLTEVMERHDMYRREAHEAIHAYLDQLVHVDGRQAVILAEEPMRPELLTSNDADNDVDYWITITDEAADSIREALAATAAAE